MATGGIPRMSVKGSDEFYLIMCSPCSTNKIDVGAEVYCLQCNEYFCGRCLKHHNSFSNMATHTIQTIVRVTCDLHPGEMYSRFCEKHQQVCCASCARIQHTSCDVKYILDVAKGAMQGPELNEFKGEIKEILKTLETAKKQRELDMQRITKEKDTEIDKIHASIQQLIKQLKEIEKSAVHDITRKFTEFKSKIENDLTALGTTIDTLNTRIDKLEKANDESEKFVYVKISDEDKSSAKNLIDTIEARVGEEKLVFLIDECVEESIRKLRSLGALVYRYAITPKNQYSVSIKKDKNTITNAMSICLSEDGGVLVADFNNKCLKIIDKSCTVITRHKLDCSPVAVCSLTASQVAVSLRDTKTIHLMTLDPVMSTTRSFKTTDYCRGIAYHADHLYVACGGLREDGEGPGHIAVYNISGTLVRKLEKDSQGQLFLSFPVGVAVRSCDDVILVCDRKRGLVALRQDGERLWMLTCEDLEVDNVSMISLDSHGQALVSSWISNKVVLVSKEGGKMGAVLTTRDGIIQPYGLCFDEQHSCLIVGMQNSNQISVFKLAY